MLKKYKKMRNLISALLFAIIFANNSFSQIKSTIGAQYFAPRIFSNIDDNDSNNPTSISFNETNLKSYTFKNDHTIVISQSNNIDLNNFQNYKFSFEYIFGTGTSYYSRNSNEFKMLVRVAMLSKIAIQKMDTYNTKIQVTSAELASNPDIYEEKIKENEYLKTEIENYKTKALNQFFQYRMLSSQTKFKGLLFPTLRYKYVNQEASDFYYSNIANKFTSLSNFNLFSNNQFAISDSILNVVSEITSLNAYGGKFDISFAISNTKQKDSLDKLKNTDPEFVKDNAKKLIRLATNSGNLSIGYATPILYLGHTKGRFHYALEFYNRAGFDIPSFSSEKLAFSNRIGLSNTLLFNLGNEFSVQILLRPSIMIIDNANKKAFKTSADAFGIYETSALVKFKSVGLTVNSFNSNRFDRDANKNKYVLGSKVLFGVVFIM